ncbi:MAG: hypothetical protein ACKO23_04225, partial [Gemmataceae bacterium]
MKDIPINPLWFLHIPKTAGCSINQFLINRFPAGQFCLIHPKAKQDPRDLLPREPVALYSGHANYDFRQFLPPDIQIFTVLRDPVERALSAYYFYRRSTLEALKTFAPGMIPILSMSLGEFVTANPIYGLKVFGNIQVSYFSRPFMHPFKQRPWIVAEDLALAKANLARCFVGLTEQLDDSLATLSREFGWPIPDVAPSQNVTQKRPKLMDLDAETRNWLEENTALDRELYDFGKQLFREWGQKLDERQNASVSSNVSTRQVRFTFDRPIPGHGWWTREQNDSGSFCWCEPDAWLTLPAPAKQDLVVEIEALPILPMKFTSNLELKIDGQTVPVQRQEGSKGLRFTAKVFRQENSGPIRLDLHVPDPIRPCDIEPSSSDNRLLSLAVKEVRLRAA